MLPSRFILMEYLPSTPHLSGVELPSAPRALFAPSLSSQRGARGYTNQVLLDWNHAAAVNS